MIRGTTLRVAFLLDSLGAGGTERSTVELAKRLPEHGVEPVLIALKRTEVGEQRHALEAGLDVRFVEPGPIPRQILCVRAELAGLRPAVLHTAIARSDLVGRFAAAGTRIPVISSLVNTPYTPYRLDDPGIRRWKLRIFQLADAVTAHLLVTRFHAVTPGVRDHARRHLGLRNDRIVVIERGRSAPDTSRRNGETPGRRHATTDEAASRPTVLAVGRHEYQKGFDTLLAALPNLGERRLVDVLIAGREGGASHALRTMKDQLGVEHPVHFLGQRSDVDDLLANADVFVLSSRYEGTAGAALEAMAAGTPIVSTRLEGMVGVLVDGHNALLVEPNDAPALGAAIARLLDDPPLASRLAAQAHADFSIRFNMDRHVERMVQLYRSTADTGRHATTSQRVDRLHLR